MIDPITVWFEITQYNNKIVISIANLVETMWLSRYPRPMEVTHDQVSEFIGREFIKSLIEEEYRIVVKPITLGNPISGVILEQIHCVIGNLVQNCNITQTYVEENGPWSVILEASAFPIPSTTNMLKVCSPFLLVFGRNMIPPKKHTVDW